MTISLEIDGVRIADDSRHGAQIPQDLTFSTVALGGYEELSCSLLTDAIAKLDPPPDAKVRVVFDAGARVGFEGRVDQLPLSKERGRNVAVAALGQNCLLDDDETLRWLGISRDTSQFGASPDDRLDYLNSVPLRPAGDASPSDGGLRLALSGETWTSAAGRPIAEAAITTAPIGVARVLGTFRKKAAAAGSTAYPSRIQSFDASWGLLDQSPDYGSTAGDAQTVDWSPTTPAQRLAIFTHAVAGSGDSGNLQHLYESLALVGDHGLQLHGSGPGNYGLLWSDVLEHLVQRFAPREISAGHIATSQAELALRHLAFDGRSTLSQIITQGSDMHQWSWGVWEGGRLHSGPYGTGRARTWFVSENDPGVRMRLAGVSRSQLWTDVVVDYRTPSGDTRSVGAPGTIAEAHDERLALADPTHPLLARGRRRRKAMSLDIVADQALATQLGRIWLAEANAARRAGQLTVQSFVRDANGVKHDPIEMQGGDHVVITSGPDQTPRRLMRTSWSPRGGLVGDLDRNSQRLPALLAQLTSRGMGTL